MMPIRSNVVGPARSTTGSNAYRPVSHRTQNFMTPNPAKTVLPGLYVMPPNLRRRIHCTRRLAHQRISGRLA
jgi:hypothetical protein